MLIRTGIAVLFSTTLMLLTVVAVFLVVEFPLAVLFIVLIVQNTFEVGAIERLIHSNFLSDKR